jgi:hypothetical protein
MFWMVFRFIDPAGQPARSRFRVYVWHVTFHQYSVSAAAPRAPPGLGKFFYHTVAPPHTLDFFCALLDPCGPRLSDGPAGWCLPKAGWDWKSCCRRNLIRRKYSRIRGGVAGP